MKDWPNINGCEECTAKDERIREDGRLADAIVARLQSRIALLEKVAGAAIVGFLA
jgi:hypothetical protein